MGAHFQVCTTLVCLTNVNDMGKWLHNAQAQVWIQIWIQSLYQLLLIYAMLLFHMCYLSPNMSIFILLCWQFWSGASYSTSAAGVWAATSKISTSTAAAAAAAAAATSDTAAINSIWPARTCCWSEAEVQRPTSSKKWVEEREVHCDVKKYLQQKERKRRRDKGCILYCKELVSFAEAVSVFRHLEAFPFLTLVFHCCLWCMYI